MRLRVTRIALVLLLLGTGCAQEAKAPATAAAPSPDQAASPSTRPASAPSPSTDTSAATSYAAERYRLVNEPGEIVSVLQNGATVIARRVPSPAISMRGYVRTGGIYEGKWLGGGLSHLLEHLVAGGSTQRRSEAENRDLLQAIGNNSNAYTSEDHTAYFINTTPQHLDEASDLLTGWMLGALITPAEYAREYEVVQRELEKGKGEPDRQFYYLSEMNRYQVSPARVPVIGYQEVIRGLSRDDVFSYYKLAYQPNNMVFSVAGDLDPEAMLSAVRKYLVDQPPGREFSRDIPPEPRMLAPRTLVATFPDLGQAKLELSFPTIRLQHPDLYALDLLAAVLGQGESSLLVEELRDRQHLVSSIYCSSFTPDYVEGSFSVQMELDADNVSAATDVVLRQLATVAAEGVSADRIERAKVLMRASRIKGQQTAEAIAASLATDLISTGDPHFSDRYVEMIGKVTAEQVQAVATRYFNRQALITTCMLPAEYVGAAGLPKAESLVRSAAATTAPTQPTTASDVTRIELPNGAILLHKRMTATPLVALRMYALGGLTAEDAQTNGLGNLAMAMLPRGTATRSARQIAEFFDSIGGDLDTGCGNNSWYWNTLCLKGDLPKAMEVLSDLVEHPAFPEPELNTMKQRVLAEIESQDADWFQQATRFFRSTYFGGTSPYQFLPIGTQETVSSFTAEQAKRWYREKVLAAPRVVAIYGDVDLAEARALAEQYLGQGERLPAIAHRKRAATESTSKVPEVASVAVERVETNRTQQPLAGVVVGFDDDSVIGENDNYTIDVADTLCSGYSYPTGYLHEILRGRGLVYVVHAQNWPGRDRQTPGTFMVYAGCDPGKVNEVVEVILENIARLQGTAADMQEAWFKRSKELAITSDALETETPAEQATTAALDELYGLGFDHHQRFPQRIEAVTVDDVRQVAAGRLSRCVVTVSTPAPDLVQVKTGRRTYRSFPPVDLTPKGVAHDAGSQ